VKDPVAQATIVASVCQKNFGDIRFVCTFGCLLISEKTIESPRATGEEDSNRIVYGGQHRPLFLFKKSDITMRARLDLVIASGRHFMITFLTNRVSYFTIYIPRLI
jgi:hypothetical protein